MNLKYKKDFAEELPEMMSKGESVCEVCAKWGITKETFFEWVKNRKEFAEAYKEARTLCQSWWEKIGRMGLFVQTNIEYDKETGKKLSQSTKTMNDRIWRLNMMNRFREDWTERQNVNVSGGMSIDIGKPPSPEAAEFPE
jgi:transposase-like protein